MENLEKVKEKLRQFYDGESSLEDEKWLEDYFSSSSVSEELLADKELFETFSARDQDIGVPEDLKKQIINNIDDLAARERRSKRISLYSMSGLAAGILALVTIYVFLLKDDVPSLYASQDTYEDPVLAYEEAMQALSYVSVKLNKGTSELSYMQQVTRTSTEPLKNLHKLNSGKHELTLLGQYKR